MAIFSTGTEDFVVGKESEKLGQKKSKKVLTNGGCFGILIERLLSGALSRDGLKEISKG
ncbi:MAG: hypothetical protein ACI4O5_00400 [Oscillospiraceae bacterium]